MSYQPLFLFLASCALAFVLLVVRLSRRSSLKNIRGPSSPSLLFGNEYEIFHQKEAGQLDSQWMREYGYTWRTHGYFGVEQVMTADPKALQHILHKSGYNYPKRLDMNHQTLLLLGPGILWSEGTQHQRQRKVMNPAFSAQHLRTFIPLFQRTTGKVIQKWWNLISENPNGVILVNKWLSRSALDIIGVPAFDYHFGALDDAEHALAKEYSTLNTDTQLYPTAWTMLYRGIWPYLPASILNLTKYTPTHVFSRFRRLNQLFIDIGTPLYSSNASDGPAVREGKKDVMSVLVRANASENERTRLNEDEVLAQMHHLTAAAQETTASTLSWMFYELAQNREYQSRMREEIRAARAAVVGRGETDFNSDDLDSMKLTMAAIKETLRAYPIVYNLWRVAAKDDVIPLSYPIIGVDGTVVNEIAVSAGQVVVISVHGYNRPVDVIWGEDADKWVPERVTRINSMDKQVKLGVYANLLSFSAGLRACIGWRFALYQMQAVAAELLEKFEFALPEDKPHMVRAPGGLTMLPMVKGKEEMGSVLPLRVLVAE
ncbi:cytochrome P450 [Daedaleopsis nitida]|nr:cytochrome P450 [Daedaleopsis nitida]